MRKWCKAKYWTENKRIYLQITRTVVPVLLVSAEL